MGRVVEVAEDDGPGRTGLRAGRLIVFLPQLSPFRAGVLPSLLQAVMTERALLDHALGPNRDIGVQMLPLGLRPLRAVPVEVLDGVGAGVGAVPAADAARVDLTDDALVVDVGRLDRADPDAGRVVAVHARAGVEAHGRVGELPLHLDLDLHPAHGAVHIGLLRGDGRDVVLALARHLTCATGGAAVQIDHHAPTRHLPPSGSFQAHARREPALKPGQRIHRTVQQRQRARDGSVRVS